MIKIKLLRELKLTFRTNNLRNGRSDRIGNNRRRNRHRRVRRRTMIENRLRHRRIYSDNREKYVRYRRNYSKRLKKKPQPQVRKLSNNQ